MKKIKKYGLLIVIAAIVGFLTSFLRHNFYLTKLFTSIRSIRLYLYIPLYLFIFFLYILIHELGHLFSFVFSGIKIRALYVLIFILMKKDGKWKFLIKLKNLKLIGGIVVPIIPPIKTEEEFEKVKEKFSRALIAGPITSVIFYLLVFVVFLLFWFFTSYYVLISILFSLVILGLPITLLIHMSSKLNTNNIYGDYVAHRKFREDEFSLVNIIQYYSFSNINDLETDLFFRNKLISYFEKNNPAYNLFSINLATYLIMYEIENKSNSSIILKTLNYYDVNILARSEYGLELAYLIAAYYYSINDVAKSYEIFNLIQININKKVSKEQQLLMKLEYEHLLNINDNEVLIRNMSLVVLKQFDILEPLFNLEEELKKMIVKLDFLEYKTDLYCEI